MKSLRKLVVGQCALKNDDLKHLGRISQLEYLDLSLCGRGVTNEGLMHLAMLKKLKTLILNTVVCITEIGVNRLKDELSGLTVRVSYNKIRAI